MKHANETKMKIDKQEFTSQILRDQNSSYIPCGLSLR